MNDVFVKRSELVEMIPLSFRTIENMERAGEFPQRIRLSPKRIVWSRQELNEWLQKLKDTRENITRGCTAAD